MKFKNVVETIEAPALGAYLAQIKAIQEKLKNADPKERIELNKQLISLRQQMNELKNKQREELQRKQIELAKADNIT